MTIVVDARLRAKVFLLLFLVSLSCFFFIEKDTFVVRKRRKYVYDNNERTDDHSSVVTGMPVESNRSPLSSSLLSRHKSQNFISNSSTGTTALCGILDYSNTEEMWDRLGPLIRSVSLPETDFFPTPVETHLRINHNLTDWIDRTWEFFQPRLYRSELHRMAERQLRAVFDILDRRIRNSTEPPLQILVMGGSPTLGHGCPANPYVTLGKEGNFGFPDCAWSTRLQEMLDAVLGTGVVVVRNVASGGTTSDISTLVFEYGLWPALPDVVINAHSINDAIKYHTLSSMVQARETFQQAVEHSRCDSDLPAVIHLDDFVAEDKISTIDKTLIVADTIHRVALWHDTMAISYSDIVRPHILSQLRNSSTVFDIFGTPLSRHPGLMFHITMAWTVLYNLLGQLSRTCRVGPQPVKDNVEKPVEHIPVIDEALKTYDVSKQWDSNLEHDKKSCASRAEQPCSYAWMSHRTTGIRNTEALEAVMKENLIENIGWKALGFPGRSPKLGWDALAQGASFTVRMGAKTGGARFLTVVVMESYGEQWLNSTLEVNVLQDDHDTQTRLLTGYHQEQTSVSVPHKIELSHKAMEGDIVTVTFSLVSGSTFKILGLALCSI